MSLAACATPPPPKPIPSIPSDWAAHLDLSHTQCNPIAGQFSNVGEHRITGAGKTEDGHLAEDVLARQLPASRPADLVILRSDTEANLLTAEIVGQVRRKIAIEISCDAGWHTFSFERSGTYVGGGLQEKRFRQAAYFRQDSGGRLVARVVMDARFISDSGSASDARAEDWYRFDRVSTILP